MTETEINTLLQKGPEITRDDLLEIDFALSAMTDDERTQMTQIVYSTLSLIVSDPAYAGDITLDDLD